MKTKNCILLIIAIIILMYSIACSFNMVEEVLDKDDGETGSQVNMAEMENYISNTSFDLPDESGPISNLPWENDSDFKQVQAQHKTDILLAAFATVLKGSLPGELHNVHLAAKSAKGLVIPPGHIFSQNQNLGPYAESRGYREGLAYIGGTVTPSIGGGVCKIASTLYNVAILSNLEIVERYNHSMPVNYLPYGQDATVAYGFKDLRFKNNTDYPVLIWALPIDNIVYIAFYGREKPPKIEWQHQVLEKRKTYTQYKINLDLDEGEEKIIAEGMDGAIVESFINIGYPDGTKEQKSLGLSSYWPMPRVIEVKNKPQ